jgi:quinol monooxygenase YgiN
VLHVVVTMMVKEGRMEEFQGLCRELRPKVLAEPGCLAYDYTRDLAGPFGGRGLEPNRVTLLERWESLEALKVHLTAKHLKETGARMAELRASVEVRCTEPIF